mmetsp:Transcript_49570/g.78816  ORF Transcript_49570/g.78816 Transcript_49570/m.78816 type:complete len:243 (-) Transcript_49570:245-973(-)
MKKRSLSFPFSVFTNEYDQAIVFLAIDFCGCGRPNNGPRLLDHHCRQILVPRFEGLKVYTIWSYNNTILRERWKNLCNAILLLLTNDKTCINTIIDIIKKFLIADHLMEAHGKFRRILATKFPPVHLESSAMYKAIELALGETVCLSPLDDVTKDQRIYKRMMRDEHGKILPTSNLAFPCVVVNLVLQTLNVGAEFFFGHRMPTLTGIGTCTFADRNVVTELKDSIIGLRVCRLRLVFAWIH